MLVDISHSDCRQLSSNDSLTLLRFSVWQMSGFSIHIKCMWVFG